MDDKNVKKHVKVISANDNIDADLKSDNQIQREIKEDRIDLEESWLLNDAETEYFAKDNNHENQDEIVNLFEEDDDLLF
jgi:hypothetical protein